jgi:hypothetical protein
LHYKSGKGGAATAATGGKVQYEEKLLQLQLHEEDARGKGVLYATLDLNLAEFTESTKTAIKVAALCFVGGKFKALMSYFRSCPLR